MMIPQTRRANAPKTVARTLIALVALVAILSTPAWADVTGSFSTHLGVFPTTQTSEVGLLEIDFQNDLTATVVTSGLSGTLHTHFGLAGVEDAIVSGQVTLGALDLSHKIVFARFPAGAITPSGPLSFLLSMLTARISLGGVTIANTAMVENTGWPDESAVAFGDELSITGSTPSGVQVTSETGFCLTRIPDKIKKHKLAEMSVDPDCEGGVKPNLVFGYETLSIDNIPVWQQAILDVQIECVQMSRCDFLETLRVTSLPFPLTTKISVSGLLNFNGMELSVPTGLGTFKVVLDANGKLGMKSTSVITLNPEANPASLRTDLLFAPGEGLKLAAFDFNVQRGVFNAGAKTFFGGRPFTFQGVILTFTGQVGFVDVHARTTLLPDGLERIEVWSTIDF